MKKLLLSLVVGSAVLASNTGFSADAPAKASKAKPTEKAASSEHEAYNVFKSFGKCGRGMANVVTSPFEIPNQMVKEAKKHDTVGGAIGGYFAGIPIGCGWMVYRLGVGVCDIVTHPIPMPTYEKSFIQPEFLFPGDPNVNE